MATVIHISESTPTPTTIIQTTVSFITSNIPTIITTLQPYLQDPNVTNTLAGEGILVVIIGIISAIIIFCVRNKRLQLIKHDQQRKHEEIARQVEAITSTL